MSGHRQGGSTRARIQEVALELFGEQGYEKTSLREIADRLGVTKAALYYYYKTKDDIVVSCVEDYLAELDEVIEWGTLQPRTDQTRREVICRYADVVLHRRAAMRFFQQNPSAERITIGSEFKARMATLHGLLVDPDGPLTQRVRALAAIASLHLAPAVLQHDGYTPEQVRDAVLSVSQDLVAAHHSAEPV
ncbi:MAG TPA: TetR/AcrR family transcriptional regulator [Mycobacteriales bacterium]|nr:TetR/AcrR family transcriptional regulator [Mycobacteriales bacterium]